VTVISHYLKYGHLSFKHSLFKLLKEQGDGLSNLGNLIPNSRLSNLAATSKDANTLALQQRGPPIFAISASASETEYMAKDLSLSDVQFAFVAMLIAIPTPAAAPHTPHSPHEPNRILLLLEMARLNDESFISNLPKFLNVANNTQLTK